MNRWNRTGMTRIELLVTVVVTLLVLILVTTQCGTRAIVKSQMIAELSNMKELHLATEQMASDGYKEGKAGLNWPGDTGGTFSNWTTQLVQENYLTKKDLAKLLSAPGVIVSPEDIPMVNTTAVLVYAVSTNSPESVVFLSSANFTNTPAGGLPPLASAKPYGNKGFVVFRKGGGGAILQSRQTGLHFTNIIGAFVPLCR